MVQNNIHGLRAEAAVNTQRDTAKDLLKPLTYNQNLVTHGFMYTVEVKQKVLKKMRLLPIRVQQKLALLVEDLRDRGPIRHDWPNYSKLGDNLHHCHLSKKWVACWVYEPETIRIEVYYAGSRENAPY